MNLKLSIHEEYAIVGCFLFARIPSKQVVRARARMEKAKTKTIQFASSIDKVPAVGILCKIYSIV